MDNYTSFEEKGYYFQDGEKIITTDEEYQKRTNYIALLNSKEEFIFRGVSEAKYKMYNSAQRLWNSISDESIVDDEEKYDEFIINLMTECKAWNLETIVNLLKTYGINSNNSIAYLGFMQHFEIPSPLIDFSRNASKAIFFAVNSISDESYMSNNEIDNYFSLYYTYKNNMAYEIFADVVEKNRKNKKVGEFDYGDITKNSIFMLSDDNSEFKILNNIRIANQEGLFFYNNSPNISVEEHYKGFSDLLIEKVGKEKAKEMLVHDTFSGCLNIHKKYASHMKSVLHDMGITQEFMFPEVEHLINYMKIKYPFK